MLTCVIVDDEPYATKLLEEYAAKVPDLTVLKTFSNPLDALDFLRGQTVDALFLDINMPKLSGMDLAKIIAPEQRIIFTTAFSEHAVQSYDVNAIDYLLKPVRFEGFLRAIEKIKTTRGLRYTAGEAILFIKSGKAMIRLTYEQVLYIEGLKDYVIFHLPGKKHIVYKRMKDLENVLPGSFRRIHLSYIINTRHLEKFEDSTALVSGVRLPVSDKYRDGFVSFLTERMV